MKLKVQKLGQFDASSMIESECHAGHIMRGDGENILRGENIHPSLQVWRESDSPIPLIATVSSGL